MPSIILRYFDCRGRAQPLRYYLEHLGVKFIDERVPFTDGWNTWAVMKGNPELSGPFGKLPVLVWDGHLLVETNLISSFLQQELDPSPKAMLINQAQSALSDDLARLYELLNLDLMAPGADIRLVSQRVESDLTDSLRCYEVAAGGLENPFLHSSGHSIAAFWLHEVVQMARSLFGNRADVLISGLSYLSEIMANLALLPALKYTNHAVPTFWTARPDEPESLALMQQILG